MLILSYKISTQLCIYENSFGAKILRDDCAHNYQLWISYHNNYLPLNPVLRDTVLATSGDGDDYGDYGDEERGDVRDVSYQEGCDNAQLEDQMAMEDTIHWVS